jgi:hypothetical protein
LFQGLIVALFITFITGAQIWNFQRLKQEKQKKERDPVDLIEEEKYGI